MSRENIRARCLVGIAVLLLALAAFSGAPRMAAAEVNLTPLDRELNSVVRGFNYKDIEVTRVLGMLADDHKMNIIISKQVSGTISIRLYNVTVRDALNEILSMSGAVMDIKDNIIHIYAKGEVPEKAREIEKAAKIEEKPVTVIYEPRFVKSEKLQTVIQPLLDPDGTIQLFNDSKSAERPQKMIITGLKSNVDYAIDLAKKLDVETSQVLIQAKIIETGISNEDLMGVDWTVKGQLSGPPFNLDAGALGKVQVGTLSLSQFQAVMQRLSTSGKSNVLSDVSLATMEGESADIHVGDQIPVGVNTVGAGGGGGISFGTTGVQQFETGVRMSVTPQILGDDLIVMKISPSVSEASSFTALGSSGGGGGGSAPVIKERTANTKIMVKSGETVVIGGLVQNNETETHTKVPILGDLPFVGGAFRKKDITKQKVDLLIFITATIMDKKTDQTTDTSQTIESPK